MTERTSSLPLSPTPYQETTQDIKVEVFPYYVEEQSDPGRNLYFYAYKIRLTNSSDCNTVQLINRHWIIRNGKGQEEEVRGEGVVGQKPVLLPLDIFEYTSFCPLNTPTGNMRGKFEFIVLPSSHNSSQQNIDREKIFAKVPLFFFRPPQTFH